MRTRLLPTIGVLLAAGVLSTAQPASAALARPTGNPPRGLPWHPPAPAPPPLPGCHAGGPGSPRTSTA